MPALRQEGQHGRRSRTPRDSHGMVAQVDETNRAIWNARAAQHGQDRYYDSAGLVAGRDWLTDVENQGVAAAIGDVRDRDILHVQCHLGFDSISLARRGARVSAVDFSPVAIAKATGLAAECGVSIDFVEADVTNLPVRLTGRFDLVYATIGILCWIDDIAAWMRSVGATLRPGGRLLLVDFHPVALMVRSVEPLVLGFPYAHDGPRSVDRRAPADAQEVAQFATVQFAHALGEIVTAAVDAGLRVICLTEHLASPIDLHGEPADADGHYRLHLGGQDLPQLYTLIAARPMG
jgi:SAM-dependent methyltransferase